MDDVDKTALNESQQRRLIITCQYIDRLLEDLERAFTEAQSNSPFGRYANDLAPAEQRLVHDYIARLRTQLLRMLDGQGLSATPRRIGLRHSLLTHLTFIDVAVEELKPPYMKGYGDVAADAAAALNGIVEELHGTIGQLTRSLAVDRSEDLRARLAATRSNPRSRAMRRCFVGGPSTGSRPFERYGRPQPTRSGLTSIDGWGTRSKERSIEPSCTRILIG